MSFDEALENLFTFEGDPPQSGSAPEGWHQYEWDNLPYSCLSLWENALNRVREKAFSHNFVWVTSSPQDVPADHTGAIIAAISPSLNELLTDHSEAFLEFILSNSPPFINS